VVGSTPPLPTGAPSSGVSPGPYFVVGVLSIDSDPRSPSSAPITVTLASASLPLATLGGTTTVTAVAGVAIFDDLVLTLPNGSTGATVTLSFAGPGTIPVTSTINVTP